MALLLLAVALATLSAYGIKERDPDAIVIRVMALFDQYGDRSIIAKDSDGQTHLFHTGMFTDSSWPISGIAKGDYLEIVPVGSSIADIRYITPLAQFGYVDEIDLGVETALVTLKERFSYTYGYMLMQSFAQQGLYFDGGYYTKGALDGFADVYADVRKGFYSDEELNDNVQRYQDEIWNEGLAADNYGERFLLIDEVAHLEPTEDITKAFSYTYGYLLALNAASQGLAIDSALYAQGGLDYASDNPLQMTEEEMQIAFFEYQQELEDEYAKWLAEVADANLKIAEEYLRTNKAQDDVITTDSGLQYQIQSPGSGPKPSAEATVEVNYQLQLIDGSVIDSSYERGESIVFNLGGLITGFREAVTQMNTGSVIRAWVHPNLGYGAEGNEMILPNSLLIFDIELLDIVD